MKPFLEWLAIGFCAFVTLVVGFYTLGTVVTHFVEKCELYMRSIE